TYNTDPWDPDSDGDGFNDGYEVIKGTDPAKPDDHPVRVWLIILIVVLGIGIIILAVWVIRITIKDTKEKGKEKN
ncbi:MAG: thrombospondin type 3 repeat-containing protein, partial [Candidatus Heimdallarchaeota archaeon]